MTKNREKREEPRKKKKKKKKYRDQKSQYARTPKSLLREVLNVPLFSNRAFSKMKLWVLNQEKRGEKYIWINACTHPSSTK